MYVRRTKPPEKDNPFYYSNKNKYYRDGYGMPNCTPYAHGRYAELCGVWFPCLGNAEDWYDVAKKDPKYKVSDKPELGAIACWKCGNVKNGKDGAGHVAIVEAINADYDITTSNSASTGTEWYEQTFYAKKNYAWKSAKTGREYQFQGFILPIVSFKERYTVSKNHFLRKEPSNNAEIVTGMIKGSLFETVGIFKVVDGSKWVRGTCNGYDGWANFKYLTNLEIY